jgi:hypothetical protein
MKQVKFGLVLLPCALINLALPLSTAAAFDAPPPNFFFILSFLFLPLDLKEADV